MSKVETRNTRLKERLLDRIDLIGLLAFSVTVLFIAFPNMLFSGNMEEIPKAVIFYRYFFVAAFIIFLVFACIILFLPKRIAFVLTSLISAYALLVIIFDIVYPLGIGPIEGEVGEVQAAPLIGVIQIVLIVIAFFILFYIPKKLRSAFAWSLAAVLFVFGLPLLFAPSHTGDIADHPSYNESELHPDFNIYHIVLDLYHGPWLQWSLTELSRGTDELAGFTHYRRNFSNYLDTRTSYPSFMSGSMYSPDQTITEWREDADKSSIIDDLHELGFSTTYYGITIHEGTRHSDVVYTKDPAKADLVDIRRAADYWLLRVAPVALRNMVLDDKGVGPIARCTRGSAEGPTGDIRTLISYRQFQKFLDDERLRPSGGHYVHAYFYPPHLPNQLDRYGNYVGESSYDEQLLLATNMILETVATLKEQGKFENSLIIIQSDHGSTYGADKRFTGDPARGFIQIDQSTSKAIRKVDLMHFSGAQIEARYQALLLLKPRGVGDDAGDLIINDALVQLLDLREYIKKAVSEEDYTYAYPEREQVDIQNGIYIQKNQAGIRLVVGRDITSGYINHYIIRPGGKWEIGDAIPFVYK